MTVQLDAAFGDDVARVMFTERVEAPRSDWPVDVPLPAGALLAEPWEPSPNGQGWFRRWHGRVFPVPNTRQCLEVRCSGIQTAEDSGARAVVRTVGVTPEVGTLTADVAAQLAVALAEAAQHSEALNAADE